MKYPWKDKVKEITEQKKVRVAAGVVAGILLLAGIVVIGSRGSTGSNTESKEGYKIIYDVPGVSFEVKKELSDYSTAVMEISKNVDFQDTGTYSFKNGKDTYLLFNINEYIVIVSKNTNFHFAETEVETALSNNSIDGIWFSTHGKNPVRKEGNNQYVIQAQAQVVITNAMYNDFYGTLTTIEKDGVEWSMFAGYTSAQKEKYSPAVEYSTSTFKLCDSNTTEIGSYVITEEGQFKRLAESTEAENQQLYVTVDKGNPDATSQPMTEPTVEPTTEPTTEPTETPAPVQTPTSTPEVLVAGETQEEVLSVLEIKKNQKNIKKDKDKVYTSSIYNMLSIGETGYITVTDEVMATYQDAYARATRIYDAKETAQLIEDHIKSENSYYKTMEAPLGTHFEAVEYDVNYLEKEPSYVNVQLCGVDGEALRYRGIIYEKRTYDIYDNVKTDGDWQTGYIAFYAVPNGCKEYVVKIGEGNPSDLLVFSTYYRVAEDE